MKKYYLVNVEFKEISENGKIQKQREQFLVNGISCLDAETIIIKKLIDEGNNLDYNIPSIKETKIIEVLYSTPSKNII